MHRIECGYGRHQYLMKDTTPGASSTAKSQQDQPRRYASLDLIIRSTHLRSKSPYDPPANARALCFGTNYTEHTFNRIRRKGIYI